MNSLTPEQTKIFFEHYKNLSYRETMIAQEFFAAGLAASQTEELQAKVKELESALKWEKQSLAELESTQGEKVAASQTEEQPIFHKNSLGLWEICLEN